MDTSSSGGCDIKPAGNFRADVALRAGDTGAPKAETWRDCARTSAAACEIPHSAAGNPAPPNTRFHFWGQGRRRKRTDASEQKLHFLVPVLGSLGDPIFGTAHSTIVSVPKTGPLFGPRNGAQNLTQESRKTRTVSPETGDPRRRKLAPWRAQKPCWGFVPGGTKTRQVHSGWSGTARDHANHASARLAWAFLSKLQVQLRRRSMCARNFRAISIAKVSRKGSCITFTTRRRQRGPKSGTKICIRTCCYMSVSRQMPTFF